MTFPGSIITARAWKTHAIKNCLNAFRSSVSLCHHPSSQKMKTIAGKEPPH